jgi:hypothetical protein
LEYFVNNQWKNLKYGLTFVENKIIIKTYIGGHKINIYEISQNGEEYKFLTFTSESEDDTKYLDFNGQLLKNNWEPLKMEIFKDKRKKKDARSDDFDASCYYDGILIINDKIKKLFEDNIYNLVEILPVNINGNRRFYYVNVINKIKSINNYATLTTEEFMEMVRKNKYDFNDKIAKKQIIFRDDDFVSKYFITEKFIEIFGEIKGLKYELVV